MVIGYNARAEYQYGHIAQDKAECEREQDSAINGGPPGAGGTWEEGCGTIEDATNCNDLTGIPDELADIVFGEQHGTCQKEGEDPTSTSKETCKNEGGEFTADSVGGYTKRIGPYIKPAGNMLKRRKWAILLIIGMKLDCTQCMKRKLASSVTVVLGLKAQEEYSLQVMKIQSK